MQNLGSFRFSCLEFLHIDGIRDLIQTQLLGWRISNNNLRHHNQRPKDDKTFFKVFDWF